MSKKAEEEFKNADDKNFYFKVEDLINLSFGPPTKNLIHCKLIQTVLLVLARHMRILEQKVEFRDHEGTTEVFFEKLSPISSSTDDKPGRVLKYRLPKLPQQLTTKAGEMIRELYETTLLPDPVQPSEKVTSESTRIRETKTVEPAVIDKFDRDEEKGKKRHSKRLIRSADDFGRSRRSGQWGIRDDYPKHRRSYDEENKPKGKNTDDLELIDNAEEIMPEETAEVVDDHQRPERNVISDIEEESYKSKKSKKDTIKDDFKRTSRKSDVERDKKDDRSRGQKYDDNDQYDDEKEVKHRSKTDKQSHIETHKDKDITDGRAKSASQVSARDKPSKSRYRPLSEKFRELNPSASSKVTLKSQEHDRRWRKPKDTEVDEILPPKLELTAEKIKKPKAFKEKIVFSKLFTPKSTENIETTTTVETSKWVDERDRDKFLIEGVKFRMRPEKLKALQIELKRRGIRLNADNFADIISSMQKRKTKDAAKKKKPMRARSEEVRREKEKSQKKRGKSAESMRKRKKDGTWDDEERTKHYMGKTGRDIDGESERGAGRKRYRDIETSSSFSSEESRDKIRRIRKSGVESDDETYREKKDKDKAKKDAEKRKRTQSAKDIKRPDSSSSKSSGDYGAGKSKKYKKDDRGRRRGSIEDESDGGSRIYDKIRSKSDDEGARRRDSDTSDYRRKERGRSLDDGGRGRRGKDKKDGENNLDEYSKKSKRKPGDYDRDKDKRGSSEEEDGKGRRDKGRSDKKRSRSEGRDREPLDEKYRRRGSSEDILGDRRKSRGEDDEFDEGGRRKGKGRGDKDGRGRGSEDDDEYGEEGRKGKGRGAKDGRGWGGEDDDFDEGGRRTGKGRGDKDGRGRGSEDDDEYGEGGRKGKGRGDKDGRGRGGEDDEFDEGGRRKGKGRGDKDGRGRGSEDDDEYEEGGRKGKGRGDKDGKGRGGEDDEFDEGGRRKGKGRGDKDGRGRGSEDDDEYGEGGRKGKSRGDKDGKGRSGEDDEFDEGGRRKGKGRGDKDGRGRGSEDDDEYGEGGRKGQGRGDKDGRDRGGEDDEFDEGGRRKGKGRGDKDGRDRGSEDDDEYREGGRKGKGRGDKDGKGRGGEDDEFDEGGRHKGKGRGDKDGRGRGSEDDDEYGEGSRKGQGRGDKDGRGRGGEDDEFDEGGRRKGKGRGDKDGRGKGSENDDEYGERGRKGKGRGDKDGKGRGGEDDVPGKRRKGEDSDIIVDDKDKDGKGRGKGRRGSQDDTAKRTDKLGKGTRKYSDIDKGSSRKTSLTVSEEDRGKEKVLVVKKRPSRVDSKGGPPRVGSIECVTQEEFRELEERVKKLQQMTGPLPPPVLPDNKKLRSDIAKGSTSLTDAMKAMQLSARVDAAEKAVDRLADMMTQLAAQGALPPELAEAANIIKAQIAGLIPKDGKEGLGFLKGAGQTGKKEGGKEDKWDGTQALGEAAADAAAAAASASGATDGRGKAVLIVPGKPPSSKTTAVSGAAWSEPGVGSGPSGTSTVSKGMARQGSGAPSSYTSKRPSRDTFLNLAVDLDDTLRTVRDELMTKLQENVGKTTTLSQNAIQIAKTVTQKLDLAMLLNDRVTTLNGVVTEYAEQLNGFDRGFSTQLAGFHQEMSQMRYEMNAGLKQLQNFNDRADSDAIMEFTDRYEKLVNELEGTIHDHLHLTSVQDSLSADLNNLLNAVENMREQKADRDEVVDALKDKADVSRLVGLLKDEDFNQARQVIDDKLLACYDKFKRQDNAWMEALHDFHGVVKEKAELIQLQAMRDEEQKELQELLEKVQVLSKILGEPKAAVLTRKISTDGRCAACRLPALMEAQVPTNIPQLPALRLPPAGAEDDEEHICLQEIPKPDSKSHVCNRWVGGSHTMLTDAIHRERAVAEPPPSCKKYLAEGSDGKVYRLEVAMLPCEECNQEPNIPGEADASMPKSGGGGDQVTLISMADARRVTIVNEDNLRSAPVVDGKSLASASRKTSVMLNLDQPQKQYLNQKVSIGARSSMSTRKSVALTQDLTTMTPAAMKFFASSIDPDVEVHRRTSDIGFIVKGRNPRMSDEEAINTAIRNEIDKMAEGRVRNEYTE